MSLFLHRILINTPPLARLQMSHSFSADQVREFREQFAAFDLDGSGQISIEELKSVLLVSSTVMRYSWEPFLTLISEIYVQIYKNCVCKS
jgi:Ca2+-binding EF-hand superfamily protein